MKNIRMFPNKRPEIMAAIRKYIAIHDGYSPSVRDLMEMTGTTSSSLIVHHLRVLEQQGSIKRYPGLARSIRILEKTSVKK
jgi:repressor LexA